MMEKMMGATRIVVGRVCVMFLRRKMGRRRCGGRMENFRGFGSSRDDEDLSGNVNEQDYGAAGPIT